MIAPTAGSPGLRLVLMGYPGGTRVIAVALEPVDNPTEAQAANEIDCLARQDAAGEGNGLAAIY
jgi:hypothetical protein